MFVDFLVSQINKSVPAAGASKAAAREVSSAASAAPVVIMVVAAGVGSMGGAPASSWIERPRLSSPSVHRSQVLHN